MKQRRSAHSAEGGHGDSTSQEEELDASLVDAEICMRLQSLEKQDANFYAAVLLRRQTLEMSELKERLQGFKPWKSERLAT